MDVLSFGSESGTIEPFLKLGSFLSAETPEYQNLIKKYLKKGESFPKARSLTLQELLSDTAADTGTFLQTPNNILGVEYCKALCRQNSTIRPLTVKREGNAYHDNSLNGQFPSASAIRALWKSADCKMSDAAVSSCFPPAISALLRRPFPAHSFWMRKIFLLIFAGFCFLLTKLSLQLIRMLHRPLYSVSFTPEVLMKAGDSMQHS